MAVPVNVYYSRCPDYFRLVLCMSLRYHEGEQAQVCFFIIQVCNGTYLPIARGIEKR